MVHAVKHARGKNLGRVVPGHLLCTTSLSALVLLAAPSVAYAQDAARHWDANGQTLGSGGSGTWNTTTENWSESTDGISGPYHEWDNAALDNAIFGGTAGTVTVGTPVTVHNITFNVHNYTLTGGTLTLGGTTPTIGGAGNATISSAITSLSGLTKGGAGTLTLSGNNAFANGGRPTHFIYG